jgi:hypothetical protein
MSQAIRKKVTFLLSVGEPRISGEVFVDNEDLHTHLCLVIILIAILYYSSLIISQCLWTFPYLLSQVTWKLRQLHMSFKIVYPWV